MCNVQECRRTYLSSRDLQAHFQHRHVKKVPPSSPASVAKRKASLNQLPPGVQVRKLAYPASMAAQLGGQGMTITIYGGGAQGGPVPPAISTFNSPFSSPSPITSSSHSRHPQTSTSSWSFSQPSTSASKLKPSTSHSSSRPPPGPLPGTAIGRPYGFPQ